MITIRLPGREDAASIVESLLKDAAVLDSHQPQLAARKRRLADAISDGINLLPARTRLPEGPQ